MIAALGVIEDVMNAVAVASRDLIANAMTEENAVLISAQFAVLVLAMVLEIALEIAATIVERAVQVVAMALAQVDVIAAAVIVAAVTVENIYMSQFYVKI